MSTHPISANNSPKKTLNPKVVWAREHLNDELTDEELGLSAGDDRENFKRSAMSLVYVGILLLPAVAWLGWQLLTSSP